MGKCSSPIAQFRTIAQCRAYRCSSIQSSQAKQSCRSWILVDSKGTHIQDSKSLQCGPSQWQWTLCTGLPPGKEPWMLAYIVQVVAWISHQVVFQSQIFPESFNLVNASFVPSVVRLSNSLESPSVAFFNISFSPISCLHSGKTTWWYWQFAVLYIRGADSVNLSLKGELKAFTTLYSIVRLDHNFPSNDETLPYLIYYPVIQTKCSITNCCMENLLWCMFRIDHSMA